MIRIIELLNIISFYFLHISLVYFENEIKEFKS